MKFRSKRLISVNVITSYDGLWFATFAHRNTDHEYSEVSFRLTRKSYERLATLLNYWATLHKGFFTVGFYGPNTWTFNILETDSVWEDYDELPY